MKKTQSRPSAVLEVCELFAGVGGFRLGFEGTSRKRNGKYKTVWANQWEPGKKRQYAAQVYHAKFPGEFPYFNENIQTVIDDHFDAIPDHDVLCGGFPCQDYSVARTLNQAAGIRGRKGVLWWSIHDIVRRKLTAEKRGRGRAPKFLVLENVDRLLKSPGTQRGRDFAIMLASLANLGYAVEWRVINAADYGFPQRRRRVFIVGHHPQSRTYKRMVELKRSGEMQRWLTRDGVLAKAFPAEIVDQLEVVPSVHLIDGHDATTQQNLVKLTQTFNKGTHSRETPFKAAGAMIGYDIWTAKVAPVYKGKLATLGSVLIPESKVPAEYFLDRSELPQWRYLKGAKSAKRVSKETGIEYSYDEGSMAFPDPLDRPSRTIVTGEGGKTPSRFKHVVTTRSGKLRRLMPIELERLNGFPDNHTFDDGVSVATRAFFMGNALVVGVVARIAKQLSKER
jgi:DNA (cytosine-5)-methyltransferase 1